MLRGDGWARARGVSNRARSRGLANRVGAGKTGRDTVCGRGGDRDINRQWTCSHTSAWHSVARVRGDAGESREFGEGGRESESEESSAESCAVLRAAGEEGSGADRKSVV